MDFLTRRGWRTGRLVVVGAAAAVVSLAGGLVLLDGDAGAVAADEVIGGIGVSDVSVADLRTVARTRIYFGHQSVRNKSDDGYGSAAYATRERLNELIRKEYRGGDLFDVAAVESTGQDGSRVSGRHDGRPYFALVDEYAADPGHLNASGAQRAAAAWLAAVAKASRR
jgi:hypothetical protein